MQDRVNILLVDDEQRNLDTLESVLDDPSYRLLRADDADKALKQLLENDVAAIVMDIKMPGVSGFELAGMIKGTKRFRQIPILFLTAYLLEERDMAAGYGAGAVDYLTKPLNPVILRHKVAVFAELFRKTRALAELNETLEKRVQERTAELEKSEAALREASNQKDRFLATLAHELRNPLAPIRTGLDILRRHPERPAGMERPLAAMNRQIDHFVRLIDDLLDVSRITRGTLELRREAVALASVVSHAIEMSMVAVAGRNQTVAFEEDGAVVTSVDPTRIAQIVGNLLSNASKHSPKEARLRVRLARDADTAIVEVTDDGVGIPSEQLEQVFDMFTKIQRATQFQNDGLGIGLAISRYLAELHRGSLVARSEGEGKGATFTLRLPIGELRSEPTVASSAERAHKRQPERLDIVLVEDNVDSAEMMSEWLEQMGHSVRVAHSGPEGISLITAAAPEVVLCDIGLPGIDGVELCRHVLGIGTRRPVMVALTGWGMEQDRKRTLDAGFEHHLVKPVNLETLDEVLRTIASSGTSS